MALEWSEHDLKIRLITYKILMYKNKKLKINAIQNVISIQKNE